MLKKILIICVGNICRSPMGEGLLKHRLATKAPQIIVASAGISALVDRPADKIAQELMQEKKIDISQHRARQATPEVLFDAELILTMETRHQQHIEDILPNLRGRVHRLGKWGSFDIPDPYQRPRLAFEQALALIEQGIIEWESKLFAGIKC